MPILPQAGICTEICEIQRGLADYLADGWNCLDVLGLAVTLSGFGFRCADPSSPWGRSLYALGAPLLFSRILFFAQVLPHQGPMVKVSGWICSFPPLSAFFLSVLVGWRAKYSNNVEAKVAQAAPHPPPKNATQFSYVDQPHVYMLFFHDNIHGVPAIHKD